jgi:hypothetical protein
MNPKVNYETQLGIVLLEVIGKIGKDTGIFIDQYVTEPCSPDCRCASKLPTMCAQLNDDVCASIETLSNAPQDLLDAPIVEALDAGTTDPNELALALALFSESEDFN